MKIAEPITVVVVAASLLLICAIVAMPIKVNHDKRKIEECDSSSGTHEYGKWELVQSQSAWTSSVQYRACNICGRIDRDGVQ